TAVEPLPAGGQLTHFPLAHQGGSRGFRLDWPGHSMAYVTDTTATPDADYPVSPCGACRQVISEFMKADAPVVFGPDASRLVHTTVSALYPYDALHELANSR
ncbi:MAG TPA: hypothetical protein PLU93_08795, partial [Treponemataceae bacterium]|nr:hypothetical protein [Treponemataceae bacterium]